MLTIAMQHAFVEGPSAGWTLQRLPHGNLSFRLDRAHQFGPINPTTMDAGPNDDTAPHSNRTPIAPVRQMTPQNARANR
jgi:hypothetical protein